MFKGYRIVVRQPGGPEAMEREDTEFAGPGPGELLMESEAIGLNFIDTYHRSGLYPLPLPFTIGSESAGTILAVGHGVTGFAPGDRIGCVQGGSAYATHRIVKAAQAVRLPDGISSEVAAATMLKGFTASYLVEDIPDLKAGDIALVHSAAGGVGSLLVPWLMDKGVVVVAHSGSAEKASRVAATHSLCVPLEELPQALREATGGRGADVVYDGVGAASWNTSLACLRKRGLMVSYGNASGPVAPINLIDLMKAGSISVIRPTMFDFVETPEMLATTAGRLFDRLERGVVSARIGQRFALTDAPAAHRAIEARETTGSTVLLP
ncbi:quinone oxidoreductase [Novosphingobium sp. PC22D]|uniref:quinone oxidoreductase family protein n=1 Tax=Novosphingobium sp. PC22D TaxID=1962403 RepID=UPI000BF0675C|nr:quinone oxidoreductase [Novosphingobium sp. PC22D]PEQ12131.1 quinone oxidoreductase [Novosphingobium sp. PC22D]